jgi:hypothetical protein
LTFDPLDWLEAGEDKTDPVVIHVRVLERYLKAVWSELGETIWLAAFEEAGAYGRSWFGPHKWPDRKSPGPCHQCTAWTSGRLKVPGDSVLPWGARQSPGGVPSSRPA